MTPNADILAEIREFLLTLFSVVERVDDRIRPHRSTQGDSESAGWIILQLPDGTQFNTLGGQSSMINGDVMIRCRAKTPDAADELAEAVRTNFTDPRSGLDGYRGPIGTNGGELLQALRTDFETGDLQDDDFDDDAGYEHVAMYSIWYQVH